MYKLLTIEEILTEYKKRKDLYPDEPEEENVQTEEPAEEEPEIQFIPDRNSELTFSAPPKTGGELKFTPRAAKKPEPVKAEVPEEEEEPAGFQRKKMTTKSGPLKWFSVKGK